MQFSSRSAIHLNLLVAFFLRIDPTKFLFSAEKSFRLRGEYYLSPRRRFLVTAERRVFVDSEQGKAMDHYNENYNHIHLREL